MKRSDLKSMIKECVREVLFEEGVLSDVIAEVAHGLSRVQPVIVESAKPKQENPAPSRAAREAAAQQRLEETKKRVLGAIGSKSMAGIFEGTEPLKSAGESSPHSPLSGTDPNDSGVDISGIMGIAGNAWKRLK